MLRKDELGYIADENPNITSYFTYMSSFGYKICFSKFVMLCPLLLYWPRVRFDICDDRLLTGVPSSLMDH